MIASEIENTEHIKYPDPKRNVVNHNEKTTRVAWKTSTGPPTQEQPQNPKSSSSEVHGACRLQSATLAVSVHRASLEITHERNPGPNGRPLELTGVNSKPRHVPEDDVSEGSTEYSSEGEVARLELERQLSVSPAAQTERDRHIAQLTDELALKSALLEQAEANVVEAARHAGPEPREDSDDRRLTRTSLVEQRDVELADIQAKLRHMQTKLDELLQSREKELANVRAKLEANESELEAVRLRLPHAEKGWTKSKAEATGSVNRDEDQVDRRVMERVRAIEAEMASGRWNEKSKEEMECRNEG